MGAAHPGRARGAVTATCIGSLPCESRPDRPRCCKVILCRTSWGMASRLQSLSDAQGWQINRKVILFYTGIFSRPGHAVKRTARLLAVTVFMAQRPTRPPGWKHNYSLTNSICLLRMLALSAPVNPSASRHLIQARTVCLVLFR